MLVVSDRGGFQRRNNIHSGLRHDPGSVRIVHRAGSFQSLRQGECNGVWHYRIRKAPAVPQVPGGCVVAMKTSPAAHTVCAHPLIVEKT